MVCTSRIFSNYRGNMFPIIDYLIIIIKNRRQQSMQKCANNKETLYINRFTYAKTHHTLLIRIPCKKKYVNK